MKKLLSLFVVAIFGVSAAMAQCTPTTETEVGIYPDTLENLPPAYIGSAYSTEIQIVMPTDTTTFVPQLGTTVTLGINYFHATGVDGLPSGFTYACNPADCKFPGGGTGCILLSGPALTAEATYDLVVHVTPNVNHQVLGDFDGPATTVEGYKIVAQPVGITEVFNTNTFQVGQNVPNPFDGTTTVNYSNPNIEEVEFTVFDMLGKVVHNEKTMSEAGMNKFVFNSATHAPGVYMYTVSNGEKAFTKRMIIAGR